MLSISVMTLALRIKIRMSPKVPAQWLPLSYKIVSLKQKLKSKASAAI